MGGNEFKHIRVNAPEEEDVVIHAGVSALAVEEPGDDARKAAAQGASDVAPLPADEAADNVRTAAQPAEPIEGAQRAVPANTPKPQQVTQPGANTGSRRQMATSGTDARTREQDFRPTTMQDLKGEPMPFVQKAVIIAAVICIIGAIVYCVGFMG